MKSVRFDAYLQDQVERAARALGISQSELIREAVARRCEEVLGPSLAERLAPVIGRINSAGGRARNAGAAFRQALARTRVQ